MRHMIAHVKQLKGYIIMTKKLEFLLADKLDEFHIRTGNTISMLYVKDIKEFQKRLPMTSTIEAVKPIRFAKFAGIDIIENNYIELPHVGVGCNNKGEFMKLIKLWDVE